MQQQMEAIKRQLETSGPTDGLMQEYQKLLDQMNDLGEQNVSGQSHAEMQKKMDSLKEEIESSDHASESVREYDRIAKRLAKKNRRNERGDSGGVVRTLSGPTSLCIPGSLAAGDPTFNRVRTQTLGTGVQSPCSLNPTANNVRYDAYEFEISDCASFPTNVTMTLCGPAGCAPPQALDTVLYVYRTGGLAGAGGAAHPFNPGDPCNNVVAANDDLNAAATGPGGSSGGVGPCSTSTVLPGLQRSLGSGRFVVVVAGLVNATAGNYNLYVDAPGAGCTITQVAGCPAITINPSSLPPGSVGVAYPTTTFTATGGAAPYTLSEAGALPTGMTFSGGVLSGTPTQAGGFPISVTATDANGCSRTRTYSLIITNTNLPCITDGLFPGDPTFNRPTVITTGSGVPSPCTLTSPGTGGSVFYKAYEFNISGCATGTITATLCGPAGCPPITNAAGLPDSEIYLYRVGGLTGPGGTPGAFDPLNPCNNLVAANDDLNGTAVAAGGSSGGLTACSAKTSLSGLRRTIGSGNFVIVVASFTNGQTGAYNLFVDIPGCTISQCSINCPANITTSNDPNQCGAVVSYPTPTTNGDCGTPVCSPASGSFFPKGTTTITCSTAAGPSCSFTVAVNDAQAPAITCPANVTQAADPNQCSAVVNYSTPTASDNCPGVGTPVCSPASGSTFAIGVTTVTCNVSDASGNSAGCSFTVTVNDSQPPTITCPADITTSTDANQCSAVVNYPAPAASDACPGAVSVVCTPASGSAFPKGATTVACTATDASGNQASCSFTVTVNDTQPPTIACPANVTQSTDANQCSAVVNYPAPTASDNCPGAGTPTCAPPAGSTFAKGTTTVSCSVSDASGNTASCSFTVTVNDTQPPSISCPANVTQSTDSNQCSAVVTYPNATATDNCPGVGTPACSPPSGSTFPKGTTTVSCSVSDASGNSANCSFTVTV
ncbi:MAG TPA: HYR domain-containing protein, partial [Blastocatellia bacterium]|nr:HYR domain-containing protein [Blastocatellia bacterium]